MIWFEIAFEIPYNLHTEYFFIKVTCTSVLYNVRNVNKIYINKIELFTVNFMLRDTNYLFNKGDDYTILSFCTFA